MTVAVGVGRRGLRGISLGRIAAVVRLLHGTVDREKTSDTARRNQTLAGELTGTAAERSSWEGDRTAGEEDSRSRGDSRTCWRETDSE